MSLYFKKIQSALIMLKALFFFAYSIFKVNHFGFYSKNHELKKVSGYCSKMENQ